MWSMAKSSLKPDGTYCLAMARQWVMKNNLPFRSAVDEATKVKQVVKPQASTKRRSVSR